MSETGSNVTIFVSYYQEHRLSAMNALYGSPKNGKECISNFVVIWTAIIDYNKIFEIWYFKILLSVLGIFSSYEV